ncbi:MAG TPA: YitT family protein [Chitinophagaceae bacterium]|nr:YitT family protein [Chitinophagaceae bacterium]
MNPLLSNIIMNSAAREARRKKRGRSSYSHTRRRLKSRTSRTNVAREVILLAAGIVSAGFGLKGFLIPNKFIDGGATGISLLTNQLTNVSFSVILVVVNLPFIILGYWQISRLFALKTILAIIGLAICVEVVDYPVVTSDKLLIAVFGGFFLGAGIGLAVRGGGVLDGTEVLAIYISRRTNLSIGDTILIFNILIFSAAAFLLDMNTALYAMLTYFVASKTVDFIIEGIEEYVGVTIVSYKNEEISNWLTNTLGAGFTVYKGVSGYGKSGHVARDTNIIYTVITRLEISRLKSEVKLIDPRAFIIMNTVIDAKGGMIRKQAIKKLHKPESGDGTA